MSALHSVMLLAALSPAAPDSSPHQARTLRVTVLSTMLTDHTGIGEWGFGALVGRSYSGPAAGVAKAKTI